MAAIYVPNVPEFAPLVAAVRAGGGVTVMARGAYTVLCSQGPIVVRRAEAGMIDAVWFSCLVGGVDGDVTAYTESELRIA